MPAAVSEPCDCFCHRCCVPPDEACSNCEESHPHEPQECMLGGSCQYDPCLDYWERKGREMYGESNPGVDRD